MIEPLLFLGLYLAAATALFTVGWNRLNRALSHDHDHTIE